MLRSQPAFCALICGVVVMARHWRTFRVTVVGASMAPTLAWGDRLLVRARAPASPGDLVVVVTPGGREAVKRVSGVAGDWMDVAGTPTTLMAGEVGVAGDNSASSTDSRDFGPLPAGAVRGRVVARYFPRERITRF